MDYVAIVTVTNTGNIGVDSLQVNVAGTKLGSAEPLAAPSPISNLAPGASPAFTLTFPQSAVQAGVTGAPLRISGTHSVNLVLLTGNWNLTFRSLSLN
jgi:hypothetical protein